MKGRTIFWVGLGVITAAGIAAFTVCRMKKSSDRDTKRRRNIVSEEGYETAADILFPETEYKVKKQVHYGPVIPLQ